MSNLNTLKISDNQLPGMTVGYQGVREYPLLLLEATYSSVLDNLKQDTFIALPQRVAVALLDSGLVCKFLPNMPLQITGDLPRTIWHSTSFTDQKQTSFTQS